MVAIFRYIHSAGGGAARSGGNDKFSVRKRAFFHYEGPTSMTLSLKISTHYKVTFSSNFIIDSKSRNGPDFCEIIAFWDTRVI